MRSRVFSSEGIVLSLRNYSEVDRIASIYTKKYGRLTFIAKGVRRLKSKKRGSLEVFTHLNFSAARGRGDLDVLTEVEVIDSFQSIKKNITKVSVAYFFVETVEKLTREEEKNEVLFKLILEYLKDLGGEVKLKKLRLEFVEEILVLLGYWPLGKKISDPDLFLQKVTEREIRSLRVGKKLLG